MVFYRISHLTDIGLMVSHSVRSLTSVRLATQSRVASRLGGRSRHPRSLPTGSPGVLWCVEWGPALALRGAGPQPHGFPDVNSKGERGRPRRPPQSGRLWARVWSPSFHVTFDIRLKGINDDGRLKQTHAALKGEVVSTGLRFASLSSLKRAAVS